MKSKLHYGYRYCAQCSLALTLHTGCIHTDVGATVVRDDVGTTTQEAECEEQS